MTEKAEWQGTYALQVYKATEVELINFAGTRADAAIYVNGSNVTLSGTIDVSGNEFGGIEVSKGSGVETEPVLNITGAELLNSDEASAIPTIWEDEIGNVDAVKRVVGYGEMKVDYNQKTDTNIQRFYYFNSTLSAPNPVEDPTDPTDPTVAPTTNTSTTESEEELLPDESVATEPIMENAVQEITK